MGWCIYHHHPHHSKVWQENFLSPKSQVEFRDGGGVVWSIYHHHPHYPRVWKENFLSPKSQVGLWGVGYWSDADTTTTPTTPKFDKKISKSRNSSLGVVGVVLVVSEHHFNHSWDIYIRDDEYCMSSHFMWRHNKYTSSLIIVDLPHEDAAICTLLTVDPTEDLVNRDSNIPSVVS